MLFNYVDAAKLVTVEAKPVHFRHPGQKDTLQLDHCLTSSFVGFLIHKAESLVSITNHKDRYASQQQMVYRWGVN